MGEIRWTEKSSEHLEAIFEYIAHDSKVYAVRFIKSLIKSTDVLKAQPLCGRVVPEINESTVREIFYKGYRIVYKVSDNNIVEILAVYHGAKNFETIEFEN